MTPCSRIRIRIGIHPGCCLYVCMNICLLRVLITLCSCVLLRIKKGFCVDYCAQITTDRQTVEATAAAVQSVTASRGQSPYNVAAAGTTTTTKTIVK